MKHCIILLLLLLTCVLRADFLFLVAVFAAPTVLAVPAADGEICGEKAKHILQLRRFRKWKKYIFSDLFRCWRTGLQVDLSVLPYKEDFGSTFWAVMKASEAAIKCASPQIRMQTACGTRKQTTNFMLSLQSWRPLSKLEREASPVDDGKPPFNFTSQMFFISFPKIRIM